MTPTALAPAALRTRPAARLGPVDRTVLALGRGVLAGFVGTAAMTASSTVEMRLSGRGASATPAQAVSEVTGVGPPTTTPSSASTRWRTGPTARGGGSPAARSTSPGLRGSLASALHGAAVLGAEQVIMPALGLGSPTPRYGASAAATDA